MPPIVKPKSSPSLKGLKSQLQPVFDPVWKGPEQDGITQSLLSSFMTCRERFWVRVVKGLKADSGFENSIEYGNMWHICEEHFAAGKDWRKPLLQYCKDAANKYPTDQEQVLKCYRCCLAQFPVYTDYWKAHYEPNSRAPLLQEISFAVPYRLPSGRIVKMRGKWDSVEVKSDAGKVIGIKLQENKTKGDIREADLQKQLTFDLQTLYYLVALERYKATQVKEGNKAWDHPIIGIKYNVIRRPLSGGRHSISQHKATKSKPEETLDQFYLRLQGLIKSEPEYFFMRWNVGISQADIRLFEETFLIPMFEQLCDWWEHIIACGVHQEKRFGPRLLNPNSPGDCGAYEDYPHFRLPYGIYNPIAKGFMSPVDGFLKNGSTTGLHRDPVLFPELA